MVQTKFYGIRGTEFWGGFRIRPLEIEFWSEGDFRLHDRFRWTRLKTDVAKWTVQRLHP